ncbi:MAG: NAD(P)-binding domain-containing protein, partial [Deltaproteobacteria bacterium]|nr:NAD(P)-binding domain-containing protein [Deltaproteobacteria bacterium]
MSIRTVTLLHPGNMGVTIGAAAATSGARVLWVSKQRGEATRKRADNAGLVEAESLDDALRQSDLVLSVCPPHAAVDVAQEVAKLKFNGVYVDANAISRNTAEQIGDIVTGAGAKFVD